MAGAILGSGESMRQTGTRCPRLLLNSVLISNIVFAAVLGGCGGGSESSGPSQYSLGGSVAGLSGSGLQLEDGATKVSISGNGTFIFPAQIGVGTSYTVTVASQPSNPTQTCSVSNSSGTISANVTSVAVQCTTNNYHLGGAVTGLAGSGLELQNEGDGNLAISASGSFTFAAQVPSGSKYAVTVAAQPSQPNQSCTVKNGAGVVGSSDVTNVQIACTTVISAANSSGVTQLGNTTGETLMQFASFMGERLTYLTGHLAANVAENCPSPYLGSNGGTATYVFKDNDGSGTLTPGDSVSITLSGCLSLSMADYVTGSVTLTLVAPTNSPTGLAFASDATLTGFQLNGLILNGSLEAQYSAADTLYSVEASVGSSPITFSYQESGWFPADTVLVSNATVSKVIDYTVPRYSVQIASNYKSQLLQGQFSVATPTALSGRLGAYPDTGMEEFTAGPSTLRYAAQNVSNNESVVGSLDQTGSGSFMDLPNLFWEQGVNGFPWWEPRGSGVVSVGARPSYMTWQLGQWSMLLMFTEPQSSDPANSILSTGMDVGTPIKLFFNAPVDPSTDTSVFNTATYVIPGQVAIPAVVAANGPILTLTPQSQLQHGELYQLTPTNTIGSPWLANGSGVYFNLSVTTLNNLQAASSPSPGVAAPGQTVQLASTGSFSTNGTIVRYSWTQTGGTSVSLSGASTPTASFVVPVSAPSGSSLQFTLTVTDANGETDSVPLTVFVLSNMKTPFVYYHAQQVATVGEEAENATLESPLGGSVTTEFDTTYNSFKFIFNGSSLYDQVNIGPGAVPIVPGSYSSSSQNPNFFQELSLFCGDTYTWTLVIHEAVAAPDGTAQTFSADFTYQCLDGIEPPYSGSVRVNSTWPLP